MVGEVTERLYGVSIIRKNSSGTDPWISSSTYVYRQEQNSNCTALNGGQIVGTVKLTPLGDEELEDLYDLWFDSDIWPAGEFFKTHKTLEDLEEALEKKDFAAFHADLDGGVRLFGVVVLTGDFPHVDVHASGDEELKPEQGAATLSAILKWAFKNTEHGSYYKYLDAEPGPIHEKFAEWGFAPVENEDALDLGWSLYAIEKDKFSGSLA